MGLGAFCTGIVFDGTRANFIGTTCSLFHPLGGPLLSSQDKQLHGLTVNHLSRALGTMYRLRDAELRLAASVAALDRITVGVLLFGERGNVIFANAAKCGVAKAIVSGDSLEKVAERLGTSENTVKSQLQSVYGEDADPSPGAARKAVDGTRVDR